MPAIRKSDDYQKMKAFYHSLIDKKIYFIFILPLIYCIGLANLLNCSLILSTSS